MNNQILLTGISIDEFRSLIDDSVKNALTELQTKEPTKEDNQLIKIDEVGKLLNVSQVTIHAWKKSGKLPFYKISNKIYFKK
jgi:excisionase family DNA binding protein